MTTVRPILDKYGIVMSIENIQMSRTGTLTEAVITWRFTNAEDPQDFLLVQSAGQGADTQDKGAGKAMTYSRKYALLNTLLIPTGEDPDRISSEELDAQSDKRSEEIVKARLSIIDLAGKKSEDGPKLVQDTLTEIFPGTAFTDLTIDQLRNLYKAVKNV